MTETAEPTATPRLRSASALEDVRPPTPEATAVPTTRSRPCGSSRPASCAARTTGRASRSSGCSSISASSRSSRRTRSPASPTRWSPSCRRSRTTPARSAGAAGSSRGSRKGTWAGHIAEHIALEFQNLAGTDVRHGKTRSAGVHGQYNCIYEYREEAVGLEAGRMAVGLVNHLVAPDDPDVFFDFAPKLENLIRLAERQAFGPSTQALIDEAVSRDIPFIRLDRHSLVQFGHGVHQQRIRATMTSKTSAIGVDIASDKSLTNRLLDSAGLPVPRADVVDDRGRRRRGREAARLPVRHQAARRQPRPRRPPRPARRRRRSVPPSRSARPEPIGRRRRRDVRRRQRLPLPRHRRQGRGHRRARAGQRHRRRRAHRPPARRHREQRPAPRHRPREGPDPDQGRRGGRGARPCPGLRARRRPAEGHLGQARADRQHVDRRDLDRPDHRGPPRQRRDRRDRGPDRRARRRRHRLHLPRHRDARPRDRRRDRRGQRRARLPDAHPPDRGRAAVRRPAGHRRRCSRPAPVGAHPDHRRDRAPTARRRPSG